MMIKEKKPTQFCAPMKKIENLKARSISYKKRKDCILKKTMQLATLCGVQACTVCIGPDGSNLEIWPEDHSQVKEVLYAYNQYVKFGKKGKQVCKISDNNMGEIEKMEKSNSRENYGFLDGDNTMFFGLAERSSESVLSALNSKLGLVYDKIKLLENCSNETNINEQEEKVVLGPNCDFRMNQLSGWERIHGSNDVSLRNEADCMFSGDISLANETKFSSNTGIDLLVLNNETRQICPSFKNWFEDPAFGVGGDFDFSVDVDQESDYVKTSCETFRNYYTDLLLSSD